MHIDLYILRKRNLTTGQDTQGFPDEGAPLSYLRSPYFLNLTYRRYYIMNNLGSNIYCFITLLLSFPSISSFYSLSTILKFLYNINLLHYGQ